MSFRLGGVYRQNNGWIVRLQRYPYNPFPGHPGAEEGQAYAVILDKRDWQPVGGDGIRDLSDGAYGPRRTEKDYGSHLLPSEVAYFDGFDKPTIKLESHYASLRANKEEPQRCALDWNKPAVWDPFPGYVVVSGNEPYTAAGPAGPFGRSTGSTDDGRSTFVNPLLRG